MVDNVIAMDATVTLANAQVVIPVQIARTSILA